MTTAIIITFCILLLIAYIFDLTSAKTKIPSVIVLLIMGWALQQATNLLWIKIPDFSFILPVLGTVGLILIVLDGALELEFDQTKLKMINKSFLGALFNILISSVIIAFLFYFFSVNPFYKCLINAIPFAIISSAIAIPSVVNFSAQDKEFIVYDSSFSDIIGITLFTFFVENSVYNGFTFAKFGLQIVIMILISLVAIIILSYLLNKIKHHIKFIPIILMIILIYSLSEIYHLPALIFILLFGLFIGNFKKLIRYGKITRFNPAILDTEVRKFKDLTTEATFLIRSLFFLALGFLTDTSDILNTQSLLLAIAIVIVIFVLRAIQLHFTYHKVIPLLFVAPRGLITILLFMSLSSFHQIPLVNNSLLIQVVLITAFILMFGIMFTDKRKKPKTKTPKPKPMSPDMDLLSKINPDDL